MGVPCRPSVCGGCSYILLEREWVHRLHPGLRHQGSGVPGEQGQGGAVLWPTGTCLAEGVGDETRGFCQGGDNRGDEHVSAFRACHCWNPAERQRGPCTCPQSQPFGESPLEREKETEAEKEEEEEKLGEGRRKKQKINVYDF